MSARWLSLMGIATAALGWVGCQMFPVRTELPRFATATVAAAVAPPHHVETLRGKLAQGMWRPTIGQSSLVASERLVRTTTPPQWWWWEYRAAAPASSDSLVERESRVSRAAAPIDLAAWLTRDGFANKEEQQARDAAIEWLCDEHKPEGWTALVLVARENAHAAARWHGRLLDLLQGHLSADAAPQVALRAAAAEAWCRHIRNESDVPLDALAPAGVLLEDPAIPEEVATTLLRELASVVPPVWIPTLDDRWEEQPTARRIAVWDGVVMQAAARRAMDEPWSSELWGEAPARQRRDPDPLIRRLCARWMALSGHPAAIEMLSTMLMETDLRVRDDAVMSLGLSADPAAVMALRKLSNQTDDLARALAVRGLAINDWSAIESFADDKSQRVRLAVAEEAQRWPEPRVAIKLRTLLTDRALDVQQAAVLAIATWPDELAGPLLLHGLEHAALNTRLQLLTAFTERFGFEPRFPVEGTADERGTAAQELAAVCPWPGDWWQKLRASETPILVATASDAVTNTDWTAAARSLLALAAGSTELETRLANWSTQPAAIEALEVALDEHGDSAVATWISTTGLPRISPWYRTFAETTAADLNRRRAAMRQLAQLTGSRPLSPRQRRLLTEQLQGEHDRQVWHEAIRLAMQQPPAHREAIVMLALNHQWPDLRKAGCQLLGQQPDAAAAMWLLPLFRDPDADVRLAAVQAAGQCGNPAVLDSVPDVHGDSIPGLRSLLGQPEDRLRWAVLESMLALHDPQAGEELQRLLAAEDPTHRRRAAVLLSQSGQRRHIATLLDAGWVERDPNVQRELLQGLVKLTNPDERPPGLSSSPAGNLELTNPDEALRQWATWRRR